VIDTLVPLCLEISMPEIGQATWRALTCQRGVEQSNRCRHRNINDTEQHAAYSSATHTRKRPFRLTWPDIGDNSPVSSLILLQNEESMKHNWAFIDRLQRRFPCAIRTNDGDARIKADIEIDTLENNLFFNITKADI